MRQGGHPLSMGGTSMTGNVLSKASRTNDWGGGGAFPTVALTAGDGWVQATAGVVTGDRMFGLSNANPDNSYCSIKHAIYFAGGTINIYEQCALKVGAGTYTATDKFRVHVNLNGTVTYEHDPGNLSAVF